MNLKKYLQKQADKDVEKLLSESDLQFCDQLAENFQQPVVTESKKPKVKFWAPLSSAVAVALVGAIVIPVAISRQSAPVNEILYKEENIASVTCSLEDFNSNSNSFEIVQLDNTSYRTELSYDTVSNDTLYYKIDVTTVISEFRFVIVINEKYNFDFELGEDLLTENLTIYSLNYKSVTADELGDVKAKYKGVINFNTETVYIEYKTIALGEQVFFEEIQSVLKLKNVS